jgi:hypothetical protein
MFLVLHPCALKGLEGRRMRRRQELSTVLVLISLKGTGFQDSGYLATSKQLL